MLKKYSLLLASAATATAVWLLCSWFYGAQVAKANQALADYKADIAQTMQLLSQRELDLMTQRQQAVAQIDTQYTKELFDAQQNIGSLLNSINTHERRVYLPAKAATCRTTVQSPTTATRVDNGEARIELNPTYANALYRIPAYGDKTAVILSALQDYVTNVCLAPQNNEATNGNRN